MYSMTLPIQIGTTVAKEVTVDIDLGKALLNTSCGLFGWMYGLFFGGIPTASAVMDIPKDPPLAPSRK